MRIGVHLRVGNDAYGARSAFIVRLALPALGTLVDVEVVSYSA